MIQQGQKAYQSLKSSLNNFDAQGVAKVTADINKLTSLPQAVKVIMQPKIRDVSQQLLQYVKLTNPQLVKSSFKKAINEFSSSFQLKPDVKKLYNDMQRQIDGKVNFQKMKQRQRNQQAKQQQKKIQNEGQKLKKIDLSEIKPQSKVIDVPIIENVQQSMRPLVQIVKSPVQYVSQRIVPASFSLLNKYAQSQGYLAAGGITGRRGKVYLGRKQIKQGNQTVILPFPKNQIPSGNTPDPVTNFNFFAGRTINAWNNFVSAETDLIAFTQKVNNKQKRLTYVQQQMKTMTIGTIRSQVLATLKLFYHRIPIQLWIRNHGQQNQLTKQILLRQFQVGDTLETNPLSLTNQVGALIMGIITPKDPKPISQTINEVMKVLGAAKTDNSIKWRKFFNYYKDKVAQFLVYSKKMGIPDATYTKLMNSQIVTHMDFMNEIEHNSKSNSQVVRMMQQIVNDRQTKKNSGTLFSTWQFTWGVPRYPCKNYVWEYE